jgi:ATP-dependent RNA helicase DeaD
MQYAHNEINKALNKMGFEQFTSIQEQTIPLIQQGLDVIGQSQTGTGKTAAFTIPFIEKIDMNDPAQQVLILCPTRELAVQVKNEVEKIALFLPALKVIAIYGGASYNTQINGLKRNPQIIVGTPGRTIDLMNRKLIKLDRLKAFVLDEADEMLKMGFKEDIELLLENANPNRQTVLFSATMPKPIIKISNEFMNNPVVIKVTGENKTNTDITQYVYHVQEQNKVEAVSRLMQVYQPELSLVFCNTKRKVDSVTRDLTKRGFKVNKIHGDLAQTSRLQVLEQFREGVINVLVATDVAARGIDIKNIEAVFNYDVPEKADFYVHRIGRTGRIGNKGRSFTLVSRREQRLFDMVAKQSSANIKKRNIPTPEKVLQIIEDNQYNMIEETIKSENTHKHDQVALRLLTNYDQIEVVSALLQQLEKHDANHSISGDINEEFNRKNHVPKNDTVYTLSIGRNQNIKPKELVDFIMKKTRLTNSQINLQKIGRSETSFSTNSDKHMRIMNGLVGAKLKGTRIKVTFKK